MIHLIITTSLINKVSVCAHDSMRENRYVECIKHSIGLCPKDIKIYIVECNGERETCLDQFKEIENVEVVYTDNNSFHEKVIHKGVTELNDIKHVINKYNIGDDEMIIKLTGRYKVLNDYFFNLVKNNIEKYDAFIKFFNVCTKQFCYNDCVLGLVAIKKKYIKYFEYKKYVEVDFASMVLSEVEQNRIYEIETLELECMFADDLRILYV